MRISASELKKLGVIDRVVGEPIGGAHRQPDVAIASLGKAIGDELGKLANVDGEKLRLKRRAKFLDMGK